MRTGTESFATALNFGFTEAGRAAAAGANFVIGARFAFAMATLATPGFGASKNGDSDLASTGVRIPKDLFLLGARCTFLVLSVCRGGDLPREKPGVALIKDTWGVREALDAMMEPVALSSSS